MGGVLIEGARACGKTTTALHFSASNVRLDSSEDMAFIAQNNPELLLSGETPRLIDEWQVAPSIWNAVRTEIDTRQDTGQFILSGSATPTDTVTMHTGAGRIARIRMRPMSLSESQDSTDEISLHELKNGQHKVAGHSKLSYAAMAELAERGGWPALLGQAGSKVSVFSRGYVDNLIHIELQGHEKKIYDPIRVERTVQSLARNIAGEATNARVLAEVNSDGRSVDEKTLRADLDSLQRVFVYEPLPAWNVDVRSRSRLRKKAKIHFADPSIALASLKIGAERLMKQPQYFGFIFESMVVRDVRSLSSQDGGEVFHYRDDAGLEIDVIIDYPDTWAAIEVKLGSSQIPEAEEHLLRLKNNKVDTAKVGDPAFLAIVTATEYAYTLPSGVHIIPLGCLGR
jgi:predicted AAA+ superfamily ATPase